MLKRTLTRTFQRAGLELVPAWRMPRWHLAQHLSALFARYAVEAVIDVGANRGQYRDFLRDEVGWRGPLLSFEPLPECFAELSRRAEADPCWTVRNVALGEAVGELALNVMHSSSLSSFLTPDADKVPAFAATNRVERRETVPVVRLDDVWRDDALTDVWRRGRLYLKLDTQGYDLNVLKGAETTLRRVCALQTELSMQPIYAGMPDARTVGDFLAVRGFELSNTFPVSHDDALAVIEMDGVYVSRGLAGSR